MVASYIFSGNRGLGSVFSSGSIVELLPHYKQSARRLLSIRAVISDQESFVSLAHDEFGDVHGREQPSWIFLNLRRDDILEVPYSYTCINPRTPI